MSAYTFNILGLDNKTQQLLPNQLKIVQSWLTHSWAISSGNLFESDLILAAQDAEIPSTYTGIVKVLKASSLNVVRDSAIYELPLRTFSLYTLLCEAESELVNKKSPGVIAAPIQKRTTLSLANKEQNSETKSSDSVSKITNKKRSKPLSDLQSVIKNIAETQSADSQKTGEKSDISVTESVSRSSISIDDTPAGRLKKLSSSIEKAKHKKPDFSSEQHSKAEKISAAQPKPETPIKRDVDPEPASPVLSNDDFNRVEKTNSIFWQSVTKRLIQLTSEGTFSFKSKKNNYWVAFHNDSNKFFTNAKNFDSLVNSLLIDPNDRWSQLDNSEISNQSKNQKDMFQVNAKSLIWSLALRETTYAMKQWGDQESLYRIARWPRLEAWESRPEFFKLCALFSTKDASLVTAAKLSNLTAEQVSAFLHACERVDIPVKARAMTAEEREAKQQSEKRAADNKAAVVSEDSASPDVQVLDNAKKPKTKEPREGSRMRLGILSALKAKLGI